jgi:DNA modification methylase
VGCGHWPNRLWKQLLRRHSRHFIGIELNPDYIEQANRRIQNQIGLLLEIARIKEENG